MDSYQARLQKQRAYRRRRILFVPKDLQNLAAWYRFNTGITVTGAGVSQWDDQSGNGRHLLQGTDANRPSLESDGSILGDGVTQYLKAAAFTLVAPTTVYILAKPITWTADDRWFDGNTANSGSLQSFLATPQIRLRATSGLSTISPPLGSYSIVTSVINGASSSSTLNNVTPVTGDVGADNMGGFTLFARGDNLAASNLQVKEVAIFSEAHDLVKRNQMIEYLASVGGVQLT